MNTTKSYIEKYNEAVQKYASRTALVFENKNLTYSEVDQLSYNIASLLQQQGVKENSLVAISLDPSLEMILTTLAILRLGAAYLPLDASYPAQRLAFMLEDSKPQLHVIHSSLLEKFNFMGSTTPRLILDSILQPLLYRPTTPL